MQTELTKLQAYNAMIKFFDIYYERTKSDDIGSLLSVMQFLINGGTADPAIWKDWLESVSVVIGSKEKLTKIQAYDAVIKFLDIYYGFTKSDDARSLLNEMHMRSEELWGNWIKCVDLTLKEPENNKPLLTFVSTDKKP